MTPPLENGSETKKPSPPPLALGSLSRVNFVGGRVEGFTVSVQAISWALAQNIPQSSRKFVLVVLANYFGENDAFPSIARLCSDTGLDRKTVMSCLQDLAAAGLIEDTKERRGVTKQIKVYRLKWSQNRNSPKTGTVPVLPIKSAVFPHKESQKRDTEPLGNRKEPLGGRVPRKFLREIDSQITLCQDRMAKCKSKGGHENAHGFQWTDEQQRQLYLRYGKRLRELEDEKLNL